MHERYFYTDPLAAAWMAKHFGMGFVLRESHPWFNAKYSIKFLAGSAHAETSNGITLLGENDYYIHPDSLHLLKPQAGDWIFQKRDMPHTGIPSVRMLQWSSDSLMEGIRLMQNDRIILRNGIAFMWPKLEIVGTATVHCLEKSELGK